MNIIQISPELYLISLDQELAGFKAFIGAWLYKGKKNILIDPGPGSTIPLLINALKQLEVKHLDLVMLTHIHIDHAGGVGDLSLHFPDTPVVCHKAGVRHMADPLRLWQGSLKILGEPARVYGEINPVNKDLLIDAAIFKDPDILIIPTPGHAVHHLSFVLDKYLFAGEAGGIFLNLSNSDFYLRPATPPRFFLETSIQSIDALLQTPHKHICYGHFGVTDKTPVILEQHKDQLLTWADIIKEQIKSCDPDNLTESCINVLVDHDPLMTGWHNFKDSILQRERYFMKNSVQWFIEYLSL